MVKELRKLRKKWKGEIWYNRVFKTKQKLSGEAAECGSAFTGLLPQLQAFRSMRTSTSRPFILDPFINLQAFSALSGESNLTVPQPFDLPFSILISANITWPAVSKNEHLFIKCSVADVVRSEMFLHALMQICTVSRRHTTVTELLFQLLPREIVGKLQHTHALKKLHFIPENLTKWDIPNKEDNM